MAGHTHDTGWQQVTHHQSTGPGGGEPDFSRVYRLGRNRRYPGGLRQWYTSHPGSKAGGEKGDDNIFVNVYYKGVKPDSFKADVQVILEGKYNKAENLFKATTLLVKCPSRYEGETPPEDHDYSTDEKKLDDEPVVEEKPLAN